MTRTNYFILFALLFGITGCKNKQQCDELPNSFTTYKYAIQAVKSSSFKIKESVVTSKSTWIKGASYYSCDGITGYFILQTKKQDYIYTAMPIEIWTGFKNADSFGSYYNSFIKHRYQFILSN